MPSSEHEWNGTHKRTGIRGCAHPATLALASFYGSGAFEILFAIKIQTTHTLRVPVKQRSSAALGCVLRGDTPHFEYCRQSRYRWHCVAEHANCRYQQFSVRLPWITSSSDERFSGGKHGHSGEEAAITAPKMMTLIDTFTS